MRKYCDGIGLVAIAFPANHFFYIDLILKLHTFTWLIICVRNSFKKKYVYVADLLDGKA